MQTHFTLAQLADPDIRESETILRSCVHCGFCTATCPTYVLLGDELDSPRGRIYLIKSMLESEAPPSPTVVRHIDRCLSCLSCMTTCPSGVHYMHLVDHARSHVERTYTRPFLDRTLRAILCLVLPYPRRFRLALRAARFARPFAGLVSGRLRAMLALAPAVVPAPSRMDRPQVHAALGPRRGRVALLPGCVQQVLGPEINAATIRLLTRHGIEVVIAPGAVCCGAVTHHMGRPEEAHDSARRTMSAWLAEMNGTGLDAILTNVSGCGTVLKDYGYQFRNDPQWREPARTVAGLVKDISEYLLALPLRTGAVSTGQAIAYHSACSLQHGQQVKAEPVTLLQRAGFTVRAVPEGHLCCGSAGTYNLLQPEIAEQLRDRKIRNIEGTRPDAIATGNIGCMAQLRTGTDLPIVHTVELLDWASGGPRPADLAKAPGRFPDARVAA